MSPLNKWDTISRLLTDGDCWLVWPRTLPFVFIGSQIIWCKVKCFKISIPQSQHEVIVFLRFIEISNFRLKFLTSSTKSEIIGENNCGEKIVEKLNTDSYTLKHFFFGWGATTLKRKNLLNNTFRTSFKNWGKALTLCDEFWHLWNSFDFANENIKQNVEPDVSKTGATIFKSGGRTSWKEVYFVCR